MDKINKFLAERPVRNKKQFMYRNKQITITKEDYKQIKGYQMNKCLTPLNMYEPLNCKFSREVREDGLPKNTKEKKSHFKKQKKKKQYIKMEYPPKNIIEDVWEGEGIESLRLEYRVEDTPRQCMAYNPGEDLSMDPNDFGNRLKRRYFAPSFVKKYKMENIFKKLPSRESFRPYPEYVSKIYKLEQTKSIAMNQFFTNAIVNKKDTVQTLNIKKYYERTITNGKIDRVIWIKNEICLVIGNTVVITKSYNLDGLENDCAEIEVTDSLGNFVKKKNCLFIKHKNRIKWITINKQNTFLGIITGKSVVVHNIKKEASMQPFKLRTEIPLQMEFGDDKPFIYVMSTNTIYVYDMLKKAVIKKQRLGLGNMQRFTLHGSLVCIQDGYDRLIITDLEEQTKIMQQSNRILFMDMHKKLNLVCLIYENEMKLIYANIEKDIYSVVKSEDGIFKSLKFHSVLPWLYVMKKNIFTIYT
ncbi:Ribosome biogenesis protein BOP1 like protein [Astathelohania contejeani]|uniref:Ribosome biogenesis protein BOP1 like protein n=1 Tax=Astathelohania contejeani TaxID=164912 RepID=A0ABQ7HWD1_9MICR|nr:Ribosome biogenesis protein BOP1 like protein [Thelohania contejeani]